MAGTGRIVVVEGTGKSIEVDSDVLVTEQRLCDLGLNPADSRRFAPMLVDAALNTPCPCCEAEAREEITKHGHSEGPQAPRG